MQKIDENIVLFFQGFHCRLLTKIFGLFIPLEFWNVVAVILVFLFLFRTKKLHAPIISFILAKCLATYSYDVLKNFFHRPRPYVAIKGFVPLITAHGFSFPSGHATLAMAMAVVLSHHFKARGLVYTLAVLVGFSRIYWGVHYLSDVLAGFLLGTLVGWLSLLLERAIISVSAAPRKTN